LRRTLWSSRRPDIQTALDVQTVLATNHLRDTISMSWVNLATEARPVG